MTDTLPAPTEELPPLPARWLRLTLRPDDVLREDEDDINVLVNTDHVCMIRSGFNNDVNHSYGSHLYFGTPRGWSDDFRDSRAPLTVNVYEELWEIEEQLHSQSCQTVERDAGPNGPPKPPERTEPKPAPVPNGPPHDAAAATQ